MKIGLILYRLGALSFLFAAGVFWEQPGLIGQNPSGLISTIILFGFSVFAGFFLLSVKVEWLTGEGRTLMLFSHGVALLSVLWLILWCFVWLAMMANMGDKAEMFIKHTSYLHLFGVGFSMAGYATGWMASQRNKRSLRFLMTTGWAVSYMAWFNLFFQPPPALKCLWAPALGGILVVLGAFLVSRQLKPKTT